MDLPVTDRSNTLMNLDFTRGINVGSTEEGNIFVGQHSLLIRDSKQTYINCTSWIMYKNTQIFVTGWEYSVEDAKFGSVHIIRIGMTSMRGGV